MRFPRARRVVASPPPRTLTRSGLDSTGCFGQLTVLISQRFAPTRFVISGGEGMGEVEDWVERDERGRVTRVSLPDRGVWVSPSFRVRGRREDRLPRQTCELEELGWRAEIVRGEIADLAAMPSSSQMANHQTLSDWIYLWSFAYLTEHHASIFITLKSSLKWIPFVGWACQLFGFIFLSRSWVADKGPFKDQLQVVAKGIEGKRGEEKKLTLLFFPEGATGLGFATRGGSKGEVLTFPWLRDARDGEYSTTVHQVRGEVVDPRL